ncbi:MAG TPA: response regulator [Leptolyngbyaceae cyanobacterium M33_DOE_097]|uniref:Circadian input-output histidine kinase CikA n=1 Tax=Oscillatoriales cyanobacterium SpSt-418 TaxID=2282169 RepID=A0A7C3PCW2_9CYAN|nr:response regulator [Leptolyngbyaceae cyanobacterium M33_DOE_097]
MTADSNGEEPKIDFFVQRIESAQERFHQLSRESENFIISPDEISVVVFEELSTALEELYIAAEEMQVQQENLIATRDKLEEERQRYQDLFNFAPNAYLVTDVEGHIQDANCKAVSLLEMSYDRLIGRLLTIFIPLEDRKVFRGRLCQIQREKDTTHEWEATLQPFQGKAISCQITLAPIYNAHQQVVGLRWLIQDVSERNRVSELEATHKVKDQFLAIVSHELRSPLNPILGWSSLLRQGRLDDEQAEYALETIERNAKLQAQLVGDLLDLSRILQGRLNLSVAPVDLELPIRAALETVQLAADAKSIQIKTYFDPTVGQTLGDVTRLQQIVWNLLNNAIKFTPEGGQVNVRLERVERETVDESQCLECLPAYSYAQITVSDTGKGIRSDLLPHVFEYFWQEDSSITRTFGGLGLGLAIVRQLVESHGGRVEAESAGEGLGSTFTVKLPLKKNKQGDKVVEEDRPLSLSPQHPLKDLHILLVEDNIDTCNLTACVLRQKGAIVTPVTSSLEALRTFEQTQFNILISDIGLPEMDGYSLLQEIRSISTHQGENILAIALSAYAGEYAHERAMSVGFQHYIPKPVEPETLVKTVVQLIEAN